MNRRRMWIALWAVYLVLQALRAVWYPEPTPADLLPPFVPLAFVVLGAVLLMSGRQRMMAGLPPPAARQVSRMHRVAVIAFGLLALFPVVADPGSEWMRTARTLAWVIGMLAMIGPVWVRAGFPRLDPPRAWWPLRVLGTAVVVMAVLQLLLRLRDLFGMLPLTDWETAGGLADCVPFAVLVLWQATSVVAGVQLVKRRPWARQWLLVSSAATLAAMALTHVFPDGERLLDLVASESRHQPWMAGWTLAPYAGALLLLAALVSPPIAAQFPAASLAARRWPLVATAACELVLFAPRLVSLPPPRFRNPEATVAETPVEPGTGELTVRLLYDGLPLEDVRDRPRRLWLTDLKARTTRTLDVAGGDGPIVVRDLATGAYRAGAVIGADSRNDLGVHDRGLPGDLRGESEPVVLRTDGERVSVDVELGRLIRLLEPEDTIRGILRAGDTPPRLTSPVHFAWDVVPGADRYTVALQVEHDERYVPETSDVVREPRWTVKLPVSRDGDVYRFSMSAWGGHRQLGGLELQGFGWYGWDYRFTVAEAFADDPQTAETWMMLPPLRGPEPDMSAPIDQWCAVTEHPTAETCRAALANLRAGHAHSLSGYSYYGALCMPVRDVHRPSRRERMRAAVEDTLKRAIGDRAEVGEPRQFGFEMDPAPALVVVAKADAPARPLLAVGLTDADGEGRTTLASDWARTGFPRVLLVGESEMMGGFADLLGRWNPEANGWFERRGAGRGAGTMLAVLPDVNVAADDLLPPRCP